MRCTALALIAFASLIVIAGCDGASGIDAQAAARIALGAEVRPRVLVEEQLQACLAASITATEAANANSLVTHGTLDTRGGAASYSETPGDVLVLREAARETRYRIAKLVVSDAAATLQEAFLLDHDVHCTASRDDAFDLDLRSNAAGNVSAREAFGTFFDGDEQELTVDVSETGTSSTSFEAAFVRYDSTARRRTEVTGDGVELSATDDDTYVLLVGDDVFENRTTALEVEGTAGGTAWSLDDGLIRRSFQNSRPAEPDFWGETDGTLQKDGADFGALEFVFGEDGEFQIVLETDDATEVLEEHLP